jgi:hypothetical protein
MTDIRQQNQIEQFLKNQGKEFQSIEPQQPKVQFAISEIDRNGQIRVKRGYRFEEYSKAEEVIAKLPAGQYQIQKVFIVD